MSQAGPAEVQARLATVTGFGGLVNAMRGMAAARAQQARTLIAGVNTYADTVAQAMGQVLSLLPPDQAPDARAGLPGSAGARAQGLCLVLGAEQGFNGGFSEQVLAAIPRPATGAPGLRCLVLGSQTQRLAATRGLPVEGGAPLVAHAESALAAGERIHALLLESLRRQPANAVDMVYAELGPGQHFQVVCRRLLPLDWQALPEAARLAPVVHESPERLLQGLAGEYVAARLAQAVLHSHASENLSRLQAMAAAQDNISHMKESLQADERRLRQEAITAEVVELAAGLRSLRAQA